jgi:hypothetical protein
MTTLLGMATARRRVMYVIRLDVGAIEDHMGRGATLRPERGTRVPSLEVHVRLRDAARQEARS